MKLKALSLFGVAAVALSTGFAGEGASAVRTASCELAAPIRVGETVSGFRVKSVTEFPDVPGRLWRMEYERNGADLVWLDRADENRTFAIAFRTIPSDDSGIAHIMEHSVLCGSAKYPVKEPFVELLKSSFATYLNAWTSADCTTYPVATKNARDYLNLVDVYLDAVFHPLSVRDDWSMRQEGWHYEFDGTNLTRNGIVYSEMKAVFANPETIGWYENVRRLFPDNAYGKVSGGDPEHIPELTFDAYRAFHSRFYHPSNARIFLDGRVDLKATLALLDTYLRDYPRRTVDAAVPRQKPVSSAATVEYACDEEGERVLLADGWVHGAFDDLEESQAMDVLCEALAGSNEAPLMKALLDAGLCKDLDLSYGGYEQGILLLSVKNTSAAKAEACRRLVRETLVRLCRDGLDQRRLAAILDRQEFRCREMDSSQRGLRFFGAVRRQWLYGGDPAADLGFTALFAKLRARLGTGWYEKLLKAAVLDNPHHAEVTLVPSRTLAARRLQAERAELARIREGLSPAALERIAADAKALKARQSAPDRAEDLAKLPRLRLKDIPAEGPVPRYAVTNVDAVTVIRPEAAVDGIVYLDLCFSLAGLSDDELLDVPFLAEALGKIGTRRFTALELRNELDGRLGAFEVSADSYAKGPQLVVRVSALEARKADALELSGEVLFGTRFDDRTAIGRLRTQRREALERSARAYGLGFARRRARRSLSERNRIDDLFGGLAQLRRMQDPREAPLADLAKKVFTRERLTLALAGRMDANFLRRAIALCPSASEPAVRPPAAAAKRMCEGYVADGAVGYTAFAAHLPADAPYRGSQLVAAKIVSLDHLWNEIRVKGGAYGGNLEVDADGNVTCASWRDPNPARSLVQFRRSAAALETFVKSGRPLESYQISTAKATEPNLSPREEAAFARRLHFNGRTPGLLQRLRKEILTTTADDLLSFARTLDELSDGASTCVFANEGLLKACSLDSVERIDSEGH